MRKSSRLRVITVDFPSAIWTLKVREAMVQNPLECLTLHTCGGPTSRPRQWESYVYCTLHIHTKPGSEASSARKDAPNFELPAAMPDDQTKELSLKDSAVDRLGSLQKSGALIYLDFRNGLEK